MYKEEELELQREALGSEIRFLQPVSCWSYVTKEAFVHSDSYSYAIRIGPRLRCSTLFNSSVFFL